MAPAAHQVPLAPQAQTARLVQSAPLELLASPAFQGLLALPEPRELQESLAPLGYQESPGFLGSRVCLVSQASQESPARVSGAYPASGQLRARRGSRLHRLWGLPDWPRQLASRRAPWALPYALPGWRVWLEMMRLCAHLFSARTLRTPWTLWISLVWRLLVWLLAR